MRISDWSSDVCSSDLIDNMVKVQEMLGDRLGDDVHMYTITTKPEVDTAESLKQYAAAKGARWKFLSGDPASIRKILTAFNVMGSIHGLTWVGNQRTGRWLTKPARVQPIFIARSEEHTSELQSIMRLSYAGFCLKNNNNNTTDHTN